MKKTDFSQHRLTDDSQLIEHLNTMGKDKFWPFAERLYRKITMMHPGESLIVDDVVVPENRDLFIKLLCAFMAGGVAQGFLFNQYFTEFRRLNLPITQSNENILKVKKI